MEKMCKTQSESAAKTGPAAKRYLWMLAYVPLYLTAFFLLQERDVNCTWVHIPLDGAIPFCEYFAVFYWAWYFLMTGVGLYLLIKDETGFRNYMLFMMAGFSICLAAYWLYPTGQQLRPAELPNSSLFSRAMGFIYRVDPSINVLPSMHAVGSFFSGAAIIMSPTVKKKRTKWGVGILNFMCAISTVFVKQHSVLDIIAAAGVCIPVFFALYAPWTVAKRRELSPPCQRRWLLAIVLGMALCLLCVLYTVKMLGA